MMENVKDEGDLEMLLGEIPHNLLHLYDHRQFLPKQPVNGGGVFYDDDPLTQIKFSGGSSLQSDGSSSSLFSGGYSFSDTGSPTPPPLEDFKSTTGISSHHGNSFWLDSTVTVREKAGESLVDELGLCANLSKMCINNQQQQMNKNPNVFPSFCDSSLSGNNLINVHVHNKQHRDLDYNSFRRGAFDSLGFQSPFPRSPNSLGAGMNPALSGLTQDFEMANLFGSSQPCPARYEYDAVLSQLNGFSGGSMDSPRHRRQMMNQNNHYCRGNLAPEFVPPLSRNPIVDDASIYDQRNGVNLMGERGASVFAQRNGVNLMGERGVPRLPNYSHCTNFRPHMSVHDLLQHGPPLSNARVVPPCNARMIPQANIDSISSEGSFIIQGEGLSYVVNRGSDRSRCSNAARQNGFAKHLQRPELDIQHQAFGAYENPRSPRIDSPFPSLPKYNSLAEARGCVYLIAKDQHGCRFLQRVFEEGTPEDVQVIFNEIIEHVVELMINPFGNYLMQKLLEVCNEEQRLQIILMVTQEPGQLVRISLNTHGTRVVQKLIETLKTRQQISLVVSALEPGFLALIKDLNGNHVVQHCLQCLSNGDNKFIFVAAAKYCAEIATHQHGCCVLQKCIGHSSGEHREKLVGEISANALLLAQDQYGNYVVQFILDLRIPSATSTIVLLFEGNYVHLAMQKFSSHVVEKCLSVLDDESRSRIIYELLSAPHFAQLLQDPHANYVVQSALKHSEGDVHNSLVEAIESHKAISRNSPYSKKIFSQKLLKK
ncbi:putative pumilio homolog 7, chloroplastic [Lotus japonicus]|uniref:putative pumilio homolog 7, chloroplastic n=1 Tax=Lotus japonicus TaxID=34305 RepID=UPI002584CAC3|nr:putative pumilio homolog 7, chloroplastic [Lotus japonicus]